MKKHVKRILSVLITFSLLISGFAIVSPAEAKPVISNNRVGMSVLPDPYFDYEITHYELGYIELDALDNAYIEPVEGETLTVWLNYGYDITGGTAELEVLSDLVDPPYGLSDNFGMRVPDDDGINREFSEEDGRYICEWDSEGSASGRIPLFCFDFTYQETPSDGEELFRFIAADIKGEYLPYGSDMTVTYDSGDEDGSEIIESGSCGEDVSYTLDNNGLLTISGTGSMRNFLSIYEAYEFEPSDESVPSQSSPYSPFRSNHTIKQIIIEDGITTVGSYAFEDCVNVSMVTLPESLEEINDYAFYNCLNLSTITLPESLMSIGVCAFIGCRSIEHLEIPGSVYYINSSAFDGSGLETIEVSEDNATYHSGGNCLIETDTKTLILGCKNSVIPDDGSVTSIGYGAFFGCGSIVRLEIPGSVSFIGLNAFDYCSGLETIEVSEDNATYHSDGNCLIETDTKTLILGCKNSVIPDDGSVTSIGYGAFYGCSDLEYIVIPDTVTSIDLYAFGECDSLKEIWIPATVTKIDEDAFDGCGDELTIHCVADSYAEEYAWKNDITYIIDIEAGDINGDAFVTADDARLAHRYDLILDGFTVSQFQAADVNGDEEVDAADVKEILKYSGMLISGFGTDDPLSGESAPAIGPDFDNFDKGEADLITLGISDDSVDGGIPSNVFVTVSAGQIKGLRSFNLYLLVDSSRLTFAGAEKGDTGIIEAGECEGHPGMVSVSFITEEEVEEESLDLCTLKFEVLRPGTTGISCIATSWDGTAFPNRSGAKISMSLGDCGADAKWFLEADELIISGNGDMNDYGLVGDVDSPPAPWVVRRELVSEVTDTRVMDGITSIGNEAMLPGETIYLPLSLESISGKAFASAKDIYYAGTKEQFDKISIDYDNPVLKNAVIHCEDESFNIELPKPSAGEGLTWELDNDGVLTVSGNGSINGSSMGEFYNISAWQYEDTKVKTAVLEDGVTGIGACVFLSDGSMTSVTIPASVTQIGRLAFPSSLKDIYFVGSKKQWDAIEISEENDALKNAAIHFITRGDADLDGVVLAKDARLVLRASAKLEEIKGQALTNCDLNGDGGLTAAEARLILRHSAGLEKNI